MPWTDEQFSLLVETAALGLTASQIGARIKKSRNAVISKIRRTNVPWNFQTVDAQTLRADHRGRPKNNRVLPHAEHIVPKLAERKSADEPPVVALDEPEIDGIKRGPVPLLELRPHHCKWPLGDPTEPQFRWCGLKRVDGKPYCRKHNRAAFMTWKRRS